MCDTDEDPLDRKLRASLMHAATDGDLQARYFALMSLARTGARAGEGEGDARAGLVDIRTFLLRRLGGAKNMERPWLALAFGVLGYGLNAEGES